MFLSKVLLPSTALAQEWAPTHDVILTLMLWFSQSREFSVYHMNLGLNLLSFFQLANFG